MKEKQISKGKKTGPADARRPGVRSAASPRGSATSAGRAARPAGAPAGARATSPRRAATGTLAYAAASVLTLVGLVLLTGCASGGGGGGGGRVTPHDDVLRQLYQRNGSIGWDGLQVGMTVAQVERALGRRLPPPGGPDELCDRHHVHVTHLRQDLDLALTGTTESATLASITLHLRGGFDRRAVVPRLDTVLGPLEFVPSRHDPALGPDEIGKPLYRTRSEYLVFLDEDPGRIELGDVCVD